MKPRPSFSLSGGGGGGDVCVQVRVCVCEPGGGDRESCASLRHVYLGSFFLDPEDIKILSLGAIWNFNEGTGLP
jgi:hypothetical protein